MNTSQDELRRGMNPGADFPSLLASAAIAVVSLTAGCSSPSAAPAAYRIEHQSAGGVEIESVRVTRVARGLRISGTVARMVGYDNSPRHHLDVEIIAPEGTVLARVATTFSPNPIGHSAQGPTSSIYSVPVPDAPPAGSVVRVSVHSVSRSDCPN